MTCCSFLINILTNFIHQANPNGSSAEPTCVVGNKRLGEEVEIAIGESRVALAADEGQSHWHGHQGMHRVHVGVSQDGC